MDKRYNEAVSVLSDGLYNALMSVPESLKTAANEIRLRIGAPIIIRTSGSVYYISENGDASFNANGIKLLRKADIEETFMKLCEYSVYSHQNDIINGFITIRGGHRAGICGTAVVENGIITAIRNISSINLRIARQIEGAAEKICSAVFENGMCNVIIAGAPSSGKTTILRDTARWLSGRGMRVSLIDERSELAGVHRGTNGNDMGFECDVLNGYPKPAGIDHAVRCMSPDVVVCDEIGSDGDAAAIKNGIYSGVYFVMGIHASNEQELFLKPSVGHLMESKAIDKAVILDGRSHPGICRSIIDVSDKSTKACGF